MAGQLTLFPNIMTRFPSTRYQGSKAKLVDWIWEQIAELEFETCLDAFGGSGAVGYRLKQAGKQVTYNDILRFNYYFGQAFIENNDTQLTEGDIDAILSHHASKGYPSFVQETFKDTYFTDEENVWIDRAITNIRHIDHPYKFALAFFALAQSCIVKRPYNLFHRKNLYLRFADVERSFGNKVSWDRPFDEWFCIFAREANHAVFDNHQENLAFNRNALDIPPQYDLVYIDTPYISGKGVGTDYRDFYHFLEGLTFYDSWSTQIDRQSKHLRLKRESNTWSDKRRIYSAFQQIFNHFQDSILVVSYRTDGIPSKSQLVELLLEYKSQVHCSHYGQYRYALSRNEESGEMLLIAQ